MNLPSLYAITGRSESEADWWRKFEAMVAAGYPLIQLRCGGDDLQSLEARALKAGKLCREAGLRLVLNGPVSLVRKLDLDGVHLTSRMLMSLEERPVSVRRIVAASCHTAAELAQAKAIGADFACLSPVRPTASHPGAEALGFEAFSRLAGACGIPVFALGGLGPENLEMVRRSGGHGVAGISAFWA